ncbi:exosporium protein D [Sutcliffiella horikoshii]|uniref:Exosporium protein D n=1 Tax=Sutcliffiella horikoshii TaxID=79883 RepID=A0A5D4TEE5_9BACI|nr:exosporium protein D [Sutcliffiella horikoshii]TYS72464.1 exosporium protein D [Sutcliffiella horikoshii]
MRCHDNKRHCRTLAITSASPQRENGSKKRVCKENSCEVETHILQGNGESLRGNIPVEVFVPAETEELVVFEDYTENINTTFLQVAVGSFNNIGGQLFVRIYTRDAEEPIEVVIVTDLGREFTSIPTGIQVENFVRLTVSNRIDFPVFLRVYAEKTFCICCNESGVQ